jgi:hypothetical protein
LAFPIADGGIVNNRVETAEPVDLHGHPAIKPSPAEEPEMNTRAILISPAL